jgi:hypothetical protein
MYFDIGFCYVLRHRLLLCTVDIGLL